MAADIAGTTRLVGLIGMPVAGSLSPRMQNAAFAALELDWAYVPLAVAAGGLDAAVRGLAALGFAGANVTIPYKLEVAPLCDELEPFAKRAGSVNTLLVRDGAIVGTSTDTAVLEGLEAERAVVLGDGGAARAFVAALQEGGAEVRVFSRRGDWPPEGAGADLIVNATPVVDEPLVEPLRGQTVVDLPYRSDGSATALVETARSAGCEVFDGLEALLRQGAASFERWTGRRAPVDVMRASLAHGREGAGERRPPPQDHS
jgi:shikimate dehydrogenase